MAKNKKANTRQKAARRTVAGKFAKAICGRECPRFAPMTWKERDKFMATPEGAAVKERYEKHMASLQ